MYKYETAQNQNKYYAFQTYAIYKSKLSCALEYMTPSNGPMIIANRTWADSMVRC